MGTNKSSRVDDAEMMIDKDETKNTALSLSARIKVTGTSIIDTPARLYIQIPIHLLSFIAGMNTLRVCHASQVPIIKNVPYSIQNIKKNLNE